MSPTLGGLAVILFLLTPSASDGQLGDRIRDRAAKSYDKHKARADSAIESQAAEAIDTTLDMAGRGVDAGITAVGELVDTVLNQIKDARFPHLRGRSRRCRSVRGRAGVRQSGASGDRAAA
jgi:hypothetical protein